MLPLKQLSFDGRSEGAERRVPSGPWHMRIQGLLICHLLKPLSHSHIGEQKIVTEFQCVKSSLANYCLGLQSEEFHCLNAFEQSMHYDCALLQGITERGVCQMFYFDLEHREQVSTISSTALVAR
jgi:hypothetical protein